MEQIVFAVPALCEYLPEETKQDVKLRTKADEQGSKIEDFFAQTDELYDEMISQQQLKGERVSGAATWKEGEQSCRAGGWRRHRSICLPSLAS